MAAREAGIPSVLITNFTFDSVYSYLSTPVPNTPSSEFGIERLYPASEDDIPIPLSVIEPLVEQILEGYRCADMLLLLPGYIPIPSFFKYPCLPAQDWVDVSSNQFHRHIVDFLNQVPSYCIPIPSSVYHHPRHVILAPLLVRSPTMHPSIHSQEGRSAFLSSVGVPAELHDPTRTKILIVSFGGQVFRVPSRPGSRSPSPGSTLVHTPFNPTVFDPVSKGHIALSQPFPCSVTSSHLRIPGAPPTSKPTIPSLERKFPESSTIPPAVVTSLHSNAVASSLLPDPSWIAIVCDAFKARCERESDQLGLPERFYVAPKEVYMPDLTAIGDVLLGKLGYGTVSECLDSCTPFVYVSRPLFIEEHGLRLLLRKEGVGIELSRHAYESGNWAPAITEAWARGEGHKARKRFQASAGIGVNMRKVEGLNMAEKVVAWTREWWINGVQLDL